MIGRIFQTRHAFAASLLAAAIGFGTPAFAAGEYEKPISPEGGWSFEGPFGRYDRAALQRGWRVYDQICSACHGMNLLSYRNLSQPGGPEFSEDEVKAIAESKQVPAGPDDQGNEVDEFGQPLTRPGRPSDNFVNPYPNEQLARSINGGAYPPDLSVINKARHYGADYVYSLLVGYSDPPPGVTGRPGQYYNKYYPGGFYAMPQPLYPDMVQYDDGTEATVEQMAADVTHFLEWAGEPKMEVRKSMGIMVMIYLLILSVLLYWSYKRIWRDVDH